MPSTRLNGEIRRQILSNAIAGQFDPQFAALDKAERELSLRIYHALVPLKHRKVLAEMRDIKSPYIEPRQFNAIGGKLHCHTGSGFNIYVLAHKDVVTPAGYGIFKVTGELGNAVDKAARARENLRQARQTATTTLGNALNKVTTLEKLLEQWPEGKKYYQSPPLKQPIMLPAIRFDTINQMLGLS